MKNTPSGDEVLVCAISLVVTVPFWLKWYFNALKIITIASVSKRQWLYWTPLGCLASVLLVLTQLADSQVRTHWLYLVLFLALAGVVLQLVAGVANLLGMGAIAGLERRNGAVIWAICGAWIGSTACVMGSNVGTGSTIYTTTASLFLSVGVFVSLWVLYALLTNNSGAIAVERDEASGLRLAGLLTAWGCVLGWAVAGDWISMTATIADFVRQAWITLPLLGIAILIERRSQPSKRQPFPRVRDAGWYPAIAYGSSAALWILHLAGWR